MYTQKFSSDVPLKHSGYTTNPAYTFNTKQEMYAKILEMATENGICRVIVNMDKLVGVACENNHCEAIINGVYNNATGNYQIVRANLYHKCSNNVEMTTKCIYNYVSRRTSLSTFSLMCRLAGMNYTIGFFEVHAFVLFAQSNQLATFTLSDIFSNIDFLIKTCIKKYSSEFERLNPDFYVSKGEQWIYFDNVQCLQVLRPVREIKQYVFQHYILILGVMFCPNDEPLISSVYLEVNTSTSTSKNALVRFLQEETKATSAIPFVYLIEFDRDVIKILDLFQKDFFIKTRSLALILSKMDRIQPDPVDHFLMLNYPINDRQMELENLINLPPNRFLRYCCKYNLWFLNNARPVEFDFICDEMCQLDYFDFHITLSCYIKWDIKSRIPEYDESIMAEAPLEVMLGNQSKAYLSKNTSKHVVDSSGCTCLKYREFGIPCEHFFETKTSSYQPENIVNTSATISFPKDPVLFSSKYFQRYQLNNIPVITPLVQMNPFLFKNLKNKTKTMFLNK